MYYVLKLTLIVTKKWIGWYRHFFLIISVTINDLVLTTYWKISSPSLILKEFMLYLRGNVNEFNSIIVPLSVIAEPGSSSLLSLQFRNSSLRICYHGGYVPNTDPQKDWIDFLALLLTEKLQVFVDSCIWQSILPIVVLGTNGDQFRQLYSLGKGHQLSTSIKKHN